MALAAQSRAMASSFLRFFRDRTQRHTTVGKTPLDEWSARRRDLYLTAHNTQNKQTSMPPAGFEPTISAGERPQTYALDRAATGTGYTLHLSCIIQHSRYSIKWKNRGLILKMWIVMSQIYVQWTSNCVKSSTFRATSSKISIQPVKHGVPYTNFRVQFPYTCNLVPWTMQIIHAVSHLNYI